jgi:hypothetical protein
MPYPKAYIPVRHYAANDAQIACKVASLHRELGNSSIAENYMENVARALSGFFQLKYRFPILTTS